MRRVSVIGNSGSGKTTTAKLVAERLGVPCIELDAVHHQPDWTPIEPDRFVERVDELTSGDAWVVDGTYRGVVEFGPVWARADTIVWLDVPRRVAMWQVSTRTIGRTITRRELWNGNRERWSNLVRWDPEHNMIRWTWTRHHEVRERYARLLTDPPTGIRVVHLRSRREIAAWLDTI